MKSIKELVEEKKKIVVEQSDIEKIEVIEELLIEEASFFDLDLETLILTCEGHIIKSFDTSEECKKVYDEIMEDYFNAVENKEKYIIVDFNKKEGF